MAHYAFLNDNNIVTEVIVGIDETELIEGLTPEEWYGNFRNQRCVRTSYNKNIRKNYAGVGYKYDEGLNAFIPPKPFNSWLLDEVSCLWYAPVEIPEIEDPYSGKYYVWNENILNWELSAICPEGKW